MKQGKITTDFQGQRLGKKIPNPDNLAMTVNDQIEQEIVQPGRNQKTLRTRFAMGICKVLRRYMTSGKEDALKGNKKKMILLKQKTWINDCTNLTARLHEMGKVEDHMSGDEMSLNLQQRLHKNIAKNVKLRFRGHTIEGKSRDENDVDPSRIDRKTSMAISRARSKGEALSKQSITLGNSNSDSSQMSLAFTKANQPNKVIQESAKPKKVEKKHSMQIINAARPKTAIDVEQVSERSTGLPKKVGYNRREAEKLDFEKGGNQLEKQRGTSSNTLTTAELKNTMKNKHSHIISVNQHQLDSMIRSNTAQKKTFTRIMLNTTQPAQLHPTKTQPSVFGIIPTTPINTLKTYKKSRFLSNGSTLSTAAGFEGRVRPSTAGGVGSLRARVNANQSDQKSLKMTIEETLREN